MEAVMKKKKKLIIVFVIITQLLLNIHFIINKKSIKETKELPKTVKKYNNVISMMLETEVSSGNYELTTRENWPTEGYIFNTDLSKCENDGEILWDNSNKKVIFNGNTSDKCYVYFDKLPHFIITDGSSNKKMYYFEYNMIWEEWVNSSYNDGNVKNKDNYIIYNDINVYTTTGPACGKMSIVENNNYNTCSGMCPNKGACG